MDDCQNVAACRSQISIGRELVLEISCPEVLALECADVVPDSLINELLEEIRIESESAYEMDYSFSVDVQDIGCDFVHEIEAEISLVGDCGQQVDCSIDITVAPEAKVFVPNVITPKENSENYITVYANPVIEEVEEFYIFDRWGELVFESFNFQPNDESAGWDGRFNNQVDQSNVYVCYAVLRSVAGEKITYKGDITLVK